MLIIPLFNGKLLYAFARLLLETKHEEKQKACRIFNRTVMHQRGIDSSCGVGELKRGRRIFFTTERCFFVR